MVELDCDALLMLQLSPSFFSREWLNSVHKLGVVVVSVVVVVVVDVVAVVVFVVLVTDVVETGLLQVARDYDAHRPRWISA